MRLRLAILGSSPCHLCTAACCRQNGHEFAVLLHEDEHARFRAFSVEIPIETKGVRRLERVLPYVDGRCQFLGDDGLCAIYEDRPRSCRAFECIDGFNRRGSSLHVHSPFLELNPPILRILESM